MFAPAATDGAAPTDPRARLAQAARAAMPAHVRGTEEACVRVGTAGRRGEGVRRRRSARARPLPPPPHERAQTPSAR